MAVWPNNRRDGLAFLPYRFTGAASGTLAYVSLAGSRYNPNVSSATGAYARTASIPEGYAPSGAATWPIKAGAMVARASAGMTATGNMLAGGPMTATWTAGMTATTSMSLNTAMTATWSAGFIAAASDMKLTLGMDATWTAGMAATANLALLVPMTATWTAGMTATADLRGFLSMSATFGGAEPLSPEGLANAVWDRLASAANNPGTMGELLNAAGAGGNPWIAAIDGAYTAGDIMRILAAVAAGKSSGHPTAPVFRDLNDTLNRVTGTVDTNGNRTATTVNP